MPNIKDDFTVIVDTREQKPWRIEKYATASKKLDTGDYSIDGFEDILAIERKRNVSEIANNITEKRFMDVIERLKNYKYAFILLEFNINNVLTYPIGSNIPQRMWDKIKISPAFIMKNILDWQIKYGINVMFCTSDTIASQTAEFIMKRVFYIEMNKRKGKNETK